MKQGFYNKNNTLKTRIITLITLAFLALAGGMDAVAQTTWTPPAAGGTFRLRSTGTGNNFNVYNAAGTAIISGGANKTKIYGLVNLSGQLNLIFDNDTTIIFDAHFFLHTNNASVTLKLGTGRAHTAVNPTLKIIGVTGHNTSISGITDNRQQVAFFLRPSSSTVATNRVVIIEGNNPTEAESYPTSYDFSNNFVIDGDGPLLTAVDDGVTMTPQVKATGGAIKTYALFRIQQGTLHLKNVTVQNFSTSWGNAGMAQVYTNNATAAIDLEFNHCLFTNIGAKSSAGSPVLRMQGQGGNNNNRDARLKYCKFENIFGSYSLAVGSTTAIDNPNATVRTVGNNQVKLSLDGCHFTHNYGCPVRWHGCSSAEPMRVNNCLIEHGFTWKDGTQVFGGGGILLKGPAEITNCTIRNNRTNGKGGGIYLSTYVDFSSGTPGLIPQHSILKLDPATVISDNVAQEYGGGVAIEAKLMRNTYGTTGTYLANTNGVIYWAVNDKGELEPFRTEFRQNGATIENNTAKGTYGGGVYISRDRSTPFYKVNCILNYGKIIGNKTGGDGKSGKGGGVAIKTYKDEEVTLAYALPTSPAAPIVEPQDVTVVVSDPDLDPGNAADEMLVYDNHSGDGGGVYVEAYPNTFTVAQYPLTNGKVSEVNTTVYATGNITTNDANDNGGGMYVEYGTVRINGGTIGGTTPAKGNNAGLDGGGIYLKDGNIYTDLVPHIETGGGGGSGRGAWQPLGSRSGSRAAVAGCNVLYNVANHDGGGMFVNSGNVFLMASNVKDNTATDGNGGGIYTNGGNVFVNYWDADNPLTGHNYSVRGEITPSDISDNTAGLNGGGINTHSGLVRMRGQTPTQKISVIGNTAINGSGGGIFCMGAGSTTEEYVTIINAKLNENKATNGTGSYTSGSHTIHKGCGGAVYLQQGVIGVTKCQMIANEANENGGGINDHAGTINAKGCKIQDNKAKNGSGGGIYTVSGDVNIFNHTDGTQTKHKTEITGNTAKLNGGGVNTHEGKVVVIGDTIDASYRILVSDNTATTRAGGGIFCMGATNSTVEYITLNGVNLINNSAPKSSGGTVVDGVTEGCGGGMYLQEGVIHVKNSDLQNNYAGWNGGGINNHKGSILVEGCLIGGDTYYNSSGTGHGNKAKNSGGGVYTNAGTIYLLDYVEESEGFHTHIESKVSHNEAEVNGGGIDTKSGNVFVNWDDVNKKQKYGDHQIEITFNKAAKGGGIYANAGTIIAANALIDNNTASLNGGGMNNHAGNITVYGGSINNNTAQEGKGGGAFTMAGDIKILPFPVEKTNPTLDDGTRIYNNIAKINGGGINTHVGKVDVRHATIKNNTATLGNGGGIFCEGILGANDGHTIRMLCSDIIQNKTLGQDGTEANPTGRGGGIYLKHGSIFAHASNINFNSANINGGGIDNHQGDILLYGCNIMENKAVMGRGGGIFTQKGDITTGPCIDRNVSTKSKATIIEKNFAHINGGGINNHEGNIFLNGDHILDNVAQTGHGGGIYIANGIINMYGGRIMRNFSYEGDGGGVWSGGGTFYINKRQGKPVVELVSIDSIGTDKVSIHYHIIDKGGLDTTALTGHGIYWGASSASTEVAFDSTVVTHYCGKETGCHYITISGLNSGTTYYAKAFATNTMNLETLSDSVAFTTRNNKPVVQTQNINKITATHASIYGEIVYNGGSNITARGVKWGTDKNNLNKTQNSTETGDFFLTTITNSTTNPIPMGDTVWVTVFATNANGTSYGDTTFFVSPKDLPDMGNGPMEIVSTTLNNGKYNVTFKYTMPSGTVFGSKAEGQLTAWGFVTSTDDDPELHADADHTIAVTTHDGMTFSGTATGLEAGTTYYVRAYASKSAEEPAAKDITNYAISTPQQFTTPSADGSPVVRATEVSGIERDKATILGKIASKGTSSISSYYLRYSTKQDFSENVVTVQGTSPAPASLSDGSEFGIAISGLAVNTTYYVRLYAENGNGTGESNNINFTTLPIDLPSVAVNITSAYDDETDDGTYVATVTCEVHNGGDNISNYGIIWQADGITPGDSIAQGNAAITTTLADGDGTYVVTLKGLTFHTKYWVQAFAENSVGNFTGRVINFTSGYRKPKLSDLTINAINYNASQIGNNNELVHTITLQGNITEKGDAPSITEYGFLYSVNFDETDLTIENVTSDEWDCGSVKATDNPSLLADYPAMMSNHVNPNQKYRIRAYAKTSYGDYEYSKDSVLITLPQVKRNGNPTFITHNSANLHGIVEGHDRQFHIREIGFIVIAAANQASPVPPTTLTLETSGALTSAHNVTSASTTSIDFNATISGLEPGKKYYWRTYAKNEDYFNEDLPLDYRKANCIAYSTITSDWFSTYQYTVSTEVIPAGAGSVSGGGSYDHNNPIQLKATAIEGYAFDHWEKIVYDPETGTPTTTNAGSNNPLNINATETATYKAFFNGPSSGSNTVSYTPTMHHPRDIYPAPAHEPWDWDDDAFFIASEAKPLGETTDTMPTDTIDDRAQRDADTITPPWDVPLIQYNRAFEGSGGGVYMTNSSPTPTRLVFSGGEADSIKGKIIYNYAKEAGGGVYIDSNAYMQMKGYCEVNANWVPNGKLGGGIYLAGRLYVGENRDDVNKHALQVNRNFALNAYSGNAIDENEDEPAGITALLNKGKLNYTEKLMRNNIMLPRNTYDFETTKDANGDNQSTVITLLSDISAKDSNGNTYTNMGFSVKNGFCPVVSTSKDFGEDFLNQNEIIDEWPFCKYYGTDSNPIAYDPVPPHYYEKWLHDLMPQGDALTLSDDGSIFEDTETYIAIHTDFNNQPFRVKYIYLWGSWTNPAVSIDPEINRPMYNGQGEGDPLWCGHYIIKNSENTVPTGVTGDTLTIPGGKQPEVLEWEIYSEEGLSWFSSYVNGLNAFTDGDTYTEGGTDTIHRKYDKKYNSYAKAKLMNDLDMSRHLWVPIGSVTKYAGGNVGESMAMGSDIYTDDDTHSYMGEFDGQGHIITGLHGQFLTGIKKYGLFGRLADTACVKNVFVDESKFITDKNDFVYHIGGIAGLMMDEAVIAGAEARTKIDSRHANPESYLGGLVGEVKGDDNKHAYIHSSMAMPEFYGGAKHVGGLVGKLGVGDTLVNSFSNPKFADSTYKDKNGSELYYYGGLVGVNDGLVENCYSRLQSREPIGDVNKTNIYGWLGGTNNAQANIKYCYAFADSIAAPHGSKYLRVGKEPVGHYSYGKTTRVNNKYGFDHRDQQIFKRDASEQLPKPGIVSDNRFIQNGILFGLLPTLDHWVDTFAVVGDRKKDYAHWERSLASPINDDYPLLMLQDFNTLGSKDCIYIHYGNDDKLLQDYNEIEDTDITYTPNVFIYDAAHISENNDPNVKVFIGEHVGITQAAGNNLSDVRVGVTFDNSSGNDLGQAYYDWHMFCTPLIEPPMGLIHHTGEYPNYPVLKNYDSGDLNLIAKGIPDDEAHYGARAFMDPPPTTWNTASGKIGYFPTDTPYGTNEGTRAGEKSLRDYTQGAFDFYMYGEYWHNHWINFKREGAYKNGSSFGLVSTVQDRDFFSDHWRQDAMKDASGNWVHYQIEYENEARMVPARGYMMAINEKWADLQYPDSIVRNPERHNMLMTDGNLRNHDEVYKTTFTIHDSPVQANDYDTEVRGTNLVGNPYQSYLDANKFLEANDAILSSKAYFVIDADHYGYIAYPKRASVNNLSAPDKIHPHQGFFVKVARTGDLVFTNDMRLAMKNIPKNEDTIYTFREQRLNYPLVNLICTDSDGMKDYTTVEINRPDPGDGAEKMRRLRTGNALIYARHDNKNYHVAFLPEGVQEVPVRFEPFADDEFKLTWNTLHGDFSYLHLIDNKTGVDVDCLNASEYRFTSKVGDYLSRFKLVFRCVGIDEDYEPDDPEGYNNQTTFAFQSGDEVVVNGSGHLDVFDVLGRCLLSTTLASETNSVSLPRNSAGVYLLRLTNNKQTKVQKMVIH